MDYQFRATIALLKLFPIQWKRIWMNLVLDRADWEAVYREVIKFC